MSQSCISLFFWLSVLLKLLKHIKLIVFENWWMQNRTSVFDKRIATWQKKNIDEEKNILLQTLQRTIFVDSKKALSLRTLEKILSIRNLKRTLITVKPKDNVINEDPQELQDLLSFAPQINLFWLFGNGIW